MDEELLYRSAIELASMVRSGELGARELAEASLARIEALEPTINAFTHVAHDYAIRAAEEISPGDPRPFAGVPIAIKDNRPVAGMPLTVGSDLFGDYVAERDSFLVRRLRDAGFVIVGKTTLSEMGILPTTETRRFGPTRNPWDLDRTPGGSSGGSAAAVAAGMVPLAHGNDGMGSIRIPSACCGLVGLKPGQDVVPSDVGNGSWYDLSENGAIATTVGDVATAMGVLAARPDLAIVREPSRLRIALSTRVPMTATPLDKHWRAAAGETGLLLREAGHTVTADDPRYSQHMVMSELARWWA